MKKSLLPILISFISLSLVGLVIVQIYWASQTHDQHREQFEQSVALTLAETARIIEAEDAKNQATHATITQRLIEKLKEIEEEQQAAVEQFFQDAGSTIIDTVHDEFTMPDMQDLENLGGEISASVDSAMAAAGDAIDWVSDMDNWDFWNDLDDIEDMADEWVDTMVNDFWDGLSATGDWIDDKASLASEWADEIFNLDNDRPLSQRLDMEELDSILIRELADRGIDTEFAWAVFDGTNAEVIIADTNDIYINEIGNSDFSIELFPHDRLEEDDPSELKIYFPDQEAHIYGKMYWVFGTTAVLIIMLIIAVSYSIITMVRQKKLSDIKNDFISNMTHELKTPISTIALACEALSDTAIQQTDAQRTSYIGMIGAENKRLGTLVESVLQTSVLEKGELKINPVLIDLNEVIETAVNNLQIRTEKLGGKLQADLKAERTQVMADRIHILNVLSNLIDNALKYTTNAPEIMISTENTEEGIIISVRDNGIGISKENQRKIFDKLFRVPTGNVHDVKGFGLGLSYVSAIVNLHHGGIDVQSEPEQGSTFRVYLPFEHFAANN